MKLHNCATGLLLALLAAWFPAVCAQAPAERPSVKSFFQNPSMSSAQMSPSGSAVAMIVRTPQGRSALVVAEVKDLKAVSVVAGFNNADVYLMRWINDNRLYFVSADSKGGTASDTIGGSSFAVDRDGKNLVQLTTSDWDYNQENKGSKIASKVLPAEYRLVSAIDDGSDDVVVGRRLYSSTDYSLDQIVLYRLDTRSRHLTRLLDASGAAPPQAITSWLLDSKGMPRIAIHAKKGRYAVYSLDPTTRKWDLLGDFDALANEGFRPEFLGFDDVLYVSSTKAGDSTSALYRYDLKQKKMAEQPLIRLDGFDFDGGAEYDHLAGKIVGIHYTTDAAGTAWLDAKFKEYQKTVDAALPGAVNTITCGHCLTSERLLVISESDRQPPRFIVFDPASGKLAQIGAARPDIVPGQMGSREFQRIAARDGLSIPVYVTMPPGKASGPLPTVVFVHGGPYVRGGYWEWEAEAQFLASRGYLVLQPEFRGSTGFGYKHFIAGRRQWGLAMQDDLADVAKWAIAKGLADPKRVGIAGASYGGYATLMGLINDPGVFRCGVEWVGVTDISLMFTSAWSDASNDQLQYGMRYLVGDPDKDADALKKVSPVAQAQRLTQPILLAYGGRDARVPGVHLTAFRDALGKTNKNVEWVFYADEGHGWFYEQNKFDFWTKVENFLDANLKKAQ
jgi:dipeptidyl aminopeptidase/acylaminoacyl peptidase